jgi:hypothetical protein
MAARKEVNETDLVEASKCLLRKPLHIEYPISTQRQVYEEVVKRLFLRLALDEYTPNPPDIRVLIADVEKEMGLRLPPSLALTFARRLGELLTEYRVVSPVTRYVLNLGKAGITGEFGVLTTVRRKRFQELYAFRMQETVEGVKNAWFRKPDVVSYARWLFLRHQEPMAPEVKVLNFSVTATDQWKDNFSEERVVRTSLAGLLDAVLLTPGFPSPGAHCASCKTMACITGRFVEVA